MLILIPRSEVLSSMRCFTNKKLPSLKLTAKTHENRVSQKGISSSNHPFSGAKMSVSGRVKLRKTHGNTFKEEHGTHEDHRHYTWFLTSQNMVNPTTNCWIHGCKSQMLHQQRCDLSRGKYNEVKNFTWENTRDFRPLL